MTLQVKSIKETLEPVELDEPIQTGENTMMAKKV